MNADRTPQGAQERPSADKVPHSPTPDGAGPAGPAATPLPNERDEAGQSTGGIPSEHMRQGHKDLKRGLRDTSRGEASDEAYQKQK